MQSQDALTVYLFKLWPWIEANKKQIMAVVGIIVAAVLVFYFVLTQREQKQIDAGKALTQMLVSTAGSQQADAYLKIAADYPSTLAGQRALLQAGATLFESGRYADAQAQFQKYLDAHPDSAFSGEAALGVAASLDAQGKSDLAIRAYKQAISSLSDAEGIGFAKLGIARIYEEQNKQNDALALYGEVARANPNSVLSSEAAMRVMELRTKSPSSPSVPASTSTTAPAAPFNLNLGN